MLQILGILAVVVLVGVLFVRPASALAIVLAVGVVVAAIIVSWHDVEQVHAQRAVAAAIRQETAPSSSVTVPPSNPAHAGS